MSVIVGAFTEELEHIEESSKAVDAAAMWKALEKIAPRVQLWSAAATVASLVPEDDDLAEIAIREALANRYNTVRPFLSLLGDTKMLGAPRLGSGSWPRSRACPRSVGAR
ncbi:hypothetical protein OG927_33945 (plasmid) [Streptomyces clavifer]|nr:MULTISPECIES: hypothetical protein [Streptomyces]KQZ12081.1 hypothetical protein ASD51_33985 [Streptomyces sp. Root55]RPK70157.1 hypothetical protein EES45_36020 [Streptomyces sp. ADI97-07]WRY79992.1 hypothetical protein OG388_01490 [Streptomyces clavifer]WRY86326.1 hypothetical protein OG388_36500 [Streptomyces clavifer]WUC32383.1 hypothetical protein OG927_33945 [Streptomyces clavifer]